MTMPLFDAKILHAPHPVLDEKGAMELAGDMMIDGWKGKPLVGYVHDGYIQLICGTQRRAAAEMAGIKVPVRLYPRALVEELWGNLEEWQKLMTGTYGVRNKTL